MLKNNFILIKAKPKTNKPLAEAVAGDLLCYNNDKLYIYPSNKFEGTPIGVVVIPTSHNVYGNGSCGVMSLVNMSCQTPDTGTIENPYIKWGGEKTGDITTLPNYDSFVHLGNSATISETIELQPIGFSYKSYLPSDRFTTLQNPYDTDTYYNVEDKYHMPSPYMEDDSRNPQYSQTSAPSTSANALSDFNGKGNTEILTNLVTLQPDWKTASTIKQEFNDGVSGYFPAACCCWRFHTLGTKQGEWYLPAIGELGYIIPKFTKIDSSIPNSEISTKVGNCACWSSTETSFNGGTTWFIQTYDGTVVTFNSREYGQIVRAFMQAGPDIVAE